MAKTPALFVLIFIALLVLGGVFLWQKDQAEVKELNKDLPEGVSVVKSFLKDDYRVVNKIDGYEFGLPEEWMGLTEIRYIPETEEENYAVASINIKGLEGQARFISIDKFKVVGENNLQYWATKIFNDYELSGDFISDNVGGRGVVIVQENIHLAGMYVYFFQDEAAIYSITGGSEEFIQEIILSGKW